MIENAYIDDMFDVIDVVFFSDEGRDLMSDIVKTVGQDAADALVPYLHEMAQMTAIGAISKTLARVEGVESAERFLTDVQLDMMEHAETCEHCSGKTQAD